MWARLAAEGVRSLRPRAAKYWEIHTNEGFAYKQN